MGRRKVLSKICIFFANFEFFKLCLKRYLENCLISFVTFNKAVSQLDYIAKLPDCKNLSRLIIIVFCSLTIIKIRNVFAIFPSKTMISQFFFFCVLQKCNRSRIILADYFIVISDQ